VRNFLGGQFLLFFEGTPLFFSSSNSFFFPLFVQTKKNHPFFLGLYSSKTDESELQPSKGKRDTKRILEIKRFLT